MENGLCLEGMSFGYDGPCNGELVFSTAMVGYPDNYGIPAMTKDEWGVCLGFECEKIHVRGLVISDYSGKFSHYDAVKSLGQWLREEKIPAICGIDTRHLTQLLRDNGTLSASILPAEEGMPSETHATLGNVRGRGPAPLGGVERSETVFKGIPPFSISASAGSRRAHSSSRGTSGAPGRVETAPKSIMLQPRASKASTRAFTASGVIARVSSRNESGVRFTTPIRIIMQR